MRLPFVASALFATATALAFRLVTFYLPPLWGVLAMRWMKKESYL